MGQPITISGITTEGDIVAFDTDRAVTGQDGAAFSSADEAASSESLPGDLAHQLFAGLEGIEHVFVASNQVVAKRAVLAASKRAGAAV